VALADELVSLQRSRVPKHIYLGVWGLYRKHPGKVSIHTFQEPGLGALLKASTFLEMWKLR